MLPRSIIFAATLAATTQRITAETHTVTFIDRCGTGTPQLWSSITGQLLSTGEPYTTNGREPALIAYLQTGSCGQAGENCTLVETTLVNGESTADINLIPPHKYSVASGFYFYDGCDGLAQDCLDSNCPDAYRHPGGPALPLCNADNVNIAITFCD